ncbi:hypothetical protein ACLOJK_020534 [Asimina triloba]
MRGSGVSTLGGDVLHEGKHPFAKRPLASNIALESQLEPSYENLLEEEDICMKKFDVDLQITEREA